MTTVDDATVTVMLRSASELLDDAERRAKGLNVPVGRLLHSVLMDWVDRLADEGVADRYDREVDRLTAALARISGRAEAARAKALGKEST